MGDVGLGVDLVLGHFRGRGHGADLFDHLVDYCRLVGRLGIEEAAVKLAQV